MKNVQTHISSQALAECNFLLSKKELGAIVFVFFFSFSLFLFFSLFNLPFLFLYIL